MKYFIALCMPLCAFKLGIENISGDVLQKLRSARVGLVTNQTGVDSQGRASFEVLKNHGIQVFSLFVPEHGLSGTIAAGKDVPSGTCCAMRVPIISLYAHGSGKIDAHTFDAVDMVILDLQDVGTRHYTYISTLYLVMQTCAQAKKPIVVLDRPNVLGAVMEGPLCLAQMRSFINIAQLPLRHGLTMGEMAHFFNKLLPERADLTVVPLADYRRDAVPDDLLVHLSPNIKSIASAHGYSFLGLLGEVQPFHVGVGSPDAFCLIMLPESLQVSHDAWLSLQQKLQAVGIQSIVKREYHERKKKWYDGLKLLFDDMNKVSSFKALMAVLDWTKKQSIPISFMRMFDASAGTPAIRSWYQGNQSLDEFLGSVKKDVQDFFDIHKDVFMYPGYPKVVRADRCFVGRVSA